MLQLLVFVVGVVGIGWLIGATNLPGEWYAALAKPGFVPSNWAFPVAWTILYIMIAVAGWRTFRREPPGRAMQSRRPLCGPRSTVRGCDYDLWGFL